MSIPHTGGRKHAFIFGLAMLSALTAPRAFGQEVLDDMVGQSEKAWTTWRDAMKAVERERVDEAAKLLDEVAGMNLSPLRLALMADRTGSLRLEQKAEAADAPENIKKLVDQIKNGRRQRALAEEGWHYAAIGRFKYADANFKALDQSAPDAVALLELARYNPNRHLVLVKLVSDAEVGPSAKRMIQILEEGEQLLRKDPYEIAANVIKLGGTPRQVDNATQFLRQSGEYAIPHLIQFLQSDKYRNLRASIIQVLPKIGRGGLNPMCIALGMKDDVTKQILIEAMGRLGYRQAVPYLAKLVADENSSAEVRSLATQVISTLGESPAKPVGQAFYELGDAYYRGEESLQADSREENANVWYLVEGALRYIPVPTPIFNDIMAMRCSEESLRADAGHGDAVALWLAANTQREARLGMDVESDKPDAAAAKDATRPENYPRSIYFNRAAGPMYCHKMLSRAVADRDPGVALGAIAALAATAGEPSLVGGEDAKQALVQALSFPNRQVRFKTAIALARALPQSPFDQCQNVVPVLAEALSQSGKMTVLVVDPDDQTRQKFVAALQFAGFEAAFGATLYQAMGNGREKNLTTFDAVCVASDVTEPDLQAAINDLRRNFQSAAAGIVIVRKPEQSVVAQRAKESATGVRIIPVEVLELGDPAKIADRITQAINQANQELGSTPLNAEMSLALAIQAADVLRLIAETNNKVYEYARGVPAMINALKHTSEELRIHAAHALALSSAPEAQAAIAEAALKAEHTPAMRVAAFDSLAESARRCGRLLNEELINRVIELTMTEKDLVLQAAASKALGALDLPSNKASEIIRAQSRG